MNDETFGESFEATLFRETLSAHRAAFAALDASHLEAVVDLSDAVRTAWAAGGKLMVCGNGGSAADAQHIVAELVGRFERDRPAKAAIALTTNASILTAVSNDYGFEEIFARQVAGLGGPNDVLLVISTSGNSPNCVRAVEEAKRLGLAVHGFLGGDGGRLAGSVDRALIAPTSETPRIQEIHITMGHILCGLLEKGMTDA